MGATETKAAILRSALGELARHGFAGAATRAIAAAAGVPQGLIRHHFGGKDGLWQAVVDEGLRSFVSDAALDDLIAAPPSQRAHALAAHVAQHRDWLAVILHALLESGPRRQWLVEERLIPLRARHARTFARVLGRSAPLGQAELLSLLGAVIAPLVTAASAGPDSGELLLRTTLSPWMAGGAGRTLPRGPWA